MNTKNHGNHFLGQETAVSMVCPQVKANKKQSPYSRRLPSFSTLMLMFWFFSETANVDRRLQEKQCSCNTCNIYMLPRSSWWLLAFILTQGEIWRSHWRVPNNKQQSMQWHHTRINIFSAKPISPPPQKKKKNSELIELFHRTIKKKKKSKIQLNMNYSYPNP